MPQRGQPRLLRIGVVVGQSSDVLRFQVTSRAHPWLRRGLQRMTTLPDPSVEAAALVNADGSVPCDVGVSSYMADRYRDRAQVVLIDGSNIQRVTQKQLDALDVVFAMYGAIAIFIDHGNHQRQRFERLLRRTTAVVWPRPDFAHLSINKMLYYKTLHDAGLPVAPFLGITVADALRDVPALVRRLRRLAWPAMIAKPSYSGYSKGIEVFHHLARQSDDELANRLRHYLFSLRLHHYPNVTLQLFVPSFGRHFEVRTYWMLGKLAYSVGTKTKRVRSSMTASLTVNEYGHPSSPTVLPHLRRLGRRVLRLLRISREPLVRIDFGCCLDDDDDGPRRATTPPYFINEVETLTANLLAEHARTSVPIHQMLGQALYHTAKRSTTAQGVP